MRNAARRWSLRSAFILSLVAIPALFTVSAASADVGLGQPTGITDEAHDMHTLYLIVTAIAAFVFVAVESALVFALLKFRKRGDDLPPQTHGNNLLEIIWTTIPVLIVLTLFVASFITLVDVEDSADQQDLTVQVQGFQFQWQFTYKKDDIGRKADPNLKMDNDVVILGTQKEEPTLVIPVNEPVEFTLLSNDVIHSFYVRDFLYKLDVIPGRDNKFKVTARETGTFTGQCAELCGTNHALMRFHIQVVERPEFDKFLAEQSANAKAAAKP